MKEEEKVIIDDSELDAMHESMKLKPIDVSKFASKEEALAYARKQMGM